MEQQPVLPGTKVVVNARYCERVLEGCPNPRVYVSQHGLPKIFARDFLYPGQVYKVLEIRNPTPMIVQVRLKEKPQSWYSVEFFDLAPQAKKPRKGKNGSA